jgi:hypothetical protein
VVVLPDGSVHPAATIRICLERKMSPVAGLHEISVGGQPVGVYLSRLGESEGLTHDGRPLMVFTRAQDDRWILEAYAIAAGEQMITFRLDPGSIRTTRRPSIASGPSEEVVLLAANAH